MIGNLRRRAAQEFSDRVMAEMKLIGVLEIHDARQGNDPRDTRLMCGQTQPELAPRGVAHYNDSARIKMLLGSVLHQKLIGRSDVLKCAGPGSAFVADPAIFKICGRNRFTGEGRAEMSAMIEIVFRAPEPPVNVDNERKGSGFVDLRRKSQIEELVWVAAVGQPLVGRWRLQRQNVIRHAEIILPTNLNREGTVRYS